MKALLKLCHYVGKLLEYIMYLFVFAALCSPLLGSMIVAGLLNLTTDDGSLTESERTGAVCLTFVAHLAIFTALWYKIGLLPGFFK